MSFTPQNPYESTLASSAASLADEWERTTFIRRTYSHLAGAIALLALFELVVFSAVPEATMAQLVGWFSQGWNWLIVIGGFMFVSSIANRWASTATSLSVQYLGLGLYVLAQGVIFIPLLFIASHYEGAVSAAALMTTIMFVSMTLMVFVTKADFSWLGRWLWMGGFAAIGLIVLGMMFNFALGAMFVGAMVVLASGYIMYHTSNVLYHFRTDQYVAASLALFASVALLFWYVLQLVTMLSGRD